MHPKRLCVAVLIILFACWSHSAESAWTYDDDPYLAAAIQTAHWLESVAIVDGGRIS